MNNLRFQTPLSSAGHPFTAGLSSNGSPGGLQFDVRGVLGLVRRQLKLILATMFGLCTVTAIALFQFTPLYAATALIMVDPRQQSILDPGSQMALPPTDQGRVESEVEILQSPSLFLSVIRDLQLFSDPEFGPHPGLGDRLAAIVGLDTPVPSAEDTLKATLETLEKATSISRLGITYLIEVTVRSKSPAQAAKIANALAQAYIADQIDAKVAMVAGIQQALFRRLDEARAAVRGSEAKLDDFIAKNVDSVADDAGRAELSDLRNQITTRAAENARLAKVFDAAQTNLASRNWDQLVSEIDSESFKDLYKRRRDLAQAVVQADGDSQKAFDLRASLAKLDGQLESEGKLAVTHVRETLDASRGSEASLRQQLRDQVIRSELPKDTLVKFYEVQQEANVSRSVYEELLTRSKGVEAQKNVQVPDSRIVSVALPPARPSFPKKTPIMALAGAISLVLGLGLAFLRENFIGGFITEAQTEQVLRISVVSSLPRLSGSDRDAAGHAGEIVDHPLSTYSEAVRRARLALEMGIQTGGDPSGCRTVLVTSAMPGEGKTQTAISIARSLAIAGHKTLLVDCDLRRPSVHKSLNMDLVTGFAEYISENEPAKALGDIILKDAGTDLSLILGLRGSRLATDTLVESSKFGDLIAQLRHEFRYVVLDSSPVIPVVDPRLLLSYADAVLMVVKWASTSQREVASAVSDLERANRNRVPIVAVLNSSNVGAAGYGSPAYYEGYSRG